MSDLPNSRQLKPATCQPPVSWYFDEEVFAQEKKRLFEGQAAPLHLRYELLQLGERLLETGLLRGLGHLETLAEAPAGGQTFPGV